MYIHQITPSSVVNGPFDRTVIHFQGCTLSCPGCFNTSTHPMKDGMDLSALKIVEQMPKGQEHVTISGGEPFLQINGLLELVQALKEKEIGIVLFSGFYKREILKMPLGNEILNNVDVLIDGRFEENKIAESGIRGSSNQTIHFLSNKYSLEQMKNRQFEMQFKENGEVIMTGFPNSIWEETIGSKS